MKLQNTLCATPDNCKIDIPVHHHFAPGVYAREVLLKKGSVTVGKIHKTEHLNIITKGRVTVSSELGVEVIVAPKVFVSPVGAKKSVFAHEDTLWITIHVTDETDIEKIESEVIAKDFNEIKMIERQAK